MDEFENNPYAPPLEVSEAGARKRSVGWQRQTARAVRLIPLAIACHAMLFGLNYLSLVGEGTWLEAVAIGTTLGFWVVSLVYHAWFGTLLYGLFWGVLLATLAAFPLVGLLALAMFYARARRELQELGWTVKGFSAKAGLEAP